MAKIFDASGGRMEPFLLHVVAVCENLLCVGVGNIYKKGFFSQMQHLYDVLFWCWLTEALDSSGQFIKKNKQNFIVCN